MEPTNCLLGENDFHLERICINPAFWTNIEKVNKFYDKCFVPELVEPRYCFNQAVRNIDDEIVIKAFDESLVDPEDHEGLLNEEDNLCKRKERSILKTSRTIIDRSSGSPRYVLSHS